MIIIIFLYMIFYTETAQALLDGLVTPIYLESRYTFTNFEFARGHVYFKKGFDLPVSGTVVLNILNPVADYIQANKSTIILGGNLVLGEDSSIKGHCFLKLGNNILQFNSDQTLSSSDILFITSNGELRGQTTPIMKLSEGALIFCQGSNIATLSNIILDGPTNKNFICLANKPGELFLNNVLLILKESLAINAPNITISNSTAIIGQKDIFLTCTNLLRFEKYADLLISSGITLKVPRLGSIDANSGLILDNASLSFYSTPTSLFVFGIYGDGRNKAPGKITFMGSSSIIAPPATSLFLSNDSIFELTSGSRCNIAPGNKITMY